MLLLRQAQTITHTHDEVINHVVRHATLYDITPVAHHFYAENPKDYHDIRRDFGGLVPPDGDTYFEFDLPPFIKLEQQLLLDESGLCSAGVLVQNCSREDVKGVERLVRALPWEWRRRAHARTTHLLSATFLLELLSNEPSVFAPVMHHCYLLGNDGLPVVPNFIQRFVNAYPTGHKECELYLPYRSLHLPVFEAIRILREGRGTKEARETLAEVCEGLKRPVKLSYQVLEP